MTYRWADSSDIIHVVKALGNGMRFEVEVAKTSRLPIDRVRVAIKSLMASNCVHGSPPSTEMGFRLLDDGNDMLKHANAKWRNARVERKARK